MEAYKTPIGILAVEDGEVVDSILFKKDPKAVAEKLTGECPEEAKFKEKHPKAKAGTGRLPLGEIAERLGFCKKGELSTFVSRVNEEMAKAGVSAGFGKDALAVNAVRAQRALERDVNTQSEALREWYSIHFPELDRLLRDNNDYAAVVSKIGPRRGMSEASLGRVLKDNRYVKAIPPIAKQSIGSSLDDEDLKAVRGFAASVLDSAEEESDLRSYIDAAMKAIAPNLSEVATPYVGALLLEQAGSLEKLALLPASTIQVLGAQKAMFRFLKTGKLPPKYGVLYLHPLVSQAPKKSKGKIARTLAAKISIAAKVDFHGGEPVGDKLRKESEERAKSLKGA